MQITFQDAEKTTEDAQTVMDWRNDPVTRKMFYNQEKKQFDQFFIEYCDNYFVENTVPPCFAVLDGKKIAFLRSSKYNFDKAFHNAYDIDINVNPEFRGKGLGSKIIAAFSKHIFSFGVEQIIAEVKKINIASSKAFQKAGYLLSDEVVKATKSGECEILRYVFQKDS